MTGSDQRVGAPLAAPRARERFRSAHVAGRRGEPDDRRANAEHVSAPTTCGTDERRTDFPPRPCGSRVAAKEIPT
jgi:hypothetical protein